MWWSPLRPLLLIFALFLASGPATAAEGTFGFSKNPPSARHDYFSSAPQDRRQRAIVERHHWERGLNALAAGQYLSAHNNLDHILRYVPNHPRALNQYSRLSIQRGEPDAAIPYFEFAIEFRPDASSTYLVYGIHRFRADQMRQAVGMFERAVELSPDSAEAHYNLGLALVELGRYADARRHAARAYELNHPLPGLRRRLREAGHWDSAAGSGAQ